MALAPASESRPADLFEDDQNCLSLELQAAIDEHERANKLSMPRLWNHDKHKHGRLGG